MNKNGIPHHLKKLIMTRAGPPPTKLWWHVGKPPDFLFRTELNNTNEELKKETKEETQRRSMMKTRSRIRNITGIFIPILLFALVLMPASSFAATPAGTVITNTATVDWSSNPGAPVPATANVTVLAQVIAPTVTTNTANSSVGELTATSIEYVIRNNSNVSDDFTLALSSTETGTLGTPNYDPLGTNSTSVSLGASVVAVDAAVATNTITIFGLAAAHNIIGGDEVYINGTAYTVNTATVNGTNTDLALYILGTTTDASLTASVGDSVFEQATLTYNITSGAYSGAVGPDTHTMDLTATSQLDNTKVSAAVNAPVITVLGATLNITKVANPTSAAPGQTVVYTITVTNLSGATASSVTVVDTVPSFTTFVSATYTTDGGTTNTPVTEVALATGINVGNLADGAVLEVTLTVTVD